LTEIRRTERCDEVSSREWEQWEKEREPNWRLVHGT